MKKSPKKFNKILSGFFNTITLGLFSRFKKHDDSNEIYNLLNRDDFFDDAERANSLCAELMDIAHKKIDLLKELQEVTKEEKELERFKLLTAEDLRKIRKLLFDHKAIEDEKESLKGRLISKNRILNTIQKYEDEVPKILKEIQEAEEKQRRVKRDVDYLEGEKEELIYNREQLENAKIMIHKVSIGTVITFGIIALIFASIIMNGNNRIFIPAVITAIAAIGMGTWLYIFRRRVEYEIVKNGRMQARAVKLLNKAKIRYVYYTNFLEYEYKKFNVDSLEQLERNWELYKKNKHHEKRYRSINSTMSRIEDEVLDILENRGIHVNYFDDIKQWSSVEERKKILMALQQEKEALESKLDFLDTYQEDIWTQLNELKERDQTENKIIEKIIQNYLEDMEAKA
ncbi:hypothetical protein [Defluviitalea saccharophila]|uniref:Uncharacterized protein n=1 Tax=Defluviitalea saccharophila TaxID=879970 RepID=A0ABZ2Y732_9FIRM